MRGRGEPCLHPPVGVSVDCGVSCAASMAESLCVCVRARVVQPRGVAGGTVGCRGKVPLTPHFPAAPLIPFTEQGFQDPPALLLPSPWLREEGGLQEETVGASPLPLLLQLTPHLPFSLLSTGWAPFLLLWRAGAGRWWPMRRGSGENLSQALPSPISSSVSTPASGRSWGMAPRPKVGEGSCWLLNCWSPLRNELGT